MVPACSRGDALQPAGGMGAQSLCTGAWPLRYCISPRLGILILHMVCPDIETKRGNGMRQSPSSKAGSGAELAGDGGAGKAAMQCHPCGASGHPTLPLRPRHKANILCLGRHQEQEGAWQAAARPRRGSLPLLVADADVSGVGSPVPPLSFLFSFFISFFLLSPGLFLKKPGRFGLCETQMPFAASSPDPISNIPVFKNKTVYEVDGEL